MNLKKWNVVGVSSEAVETVSIFQESAQRVCSLGFDVVVVGKPKKLTKLVDAMVQERTHQSMRDVVEYCGSFAKELQLDSSEFDIKLLFGQLEDALGLLFSSYCKSDEEESKMQVSVLCREFFAMLFMAELRGIRQNVEYLDARSVVYTNTAGNSCSDFAQDLINMLVRSSVKSTDTVYVMADGVGSLKALGSTPTLIGEPDITAAIMASALSSEREPAGLSYIKDIFSLGLHEFIGIKKLCSFMESSGREVISPYIQSVDNLPYVMRLLDVKNPSYVVSVTLDPLIIEMWRDGLSES
jgi:hypothetical protein